MDTAKRKEIILCLDRIVAWDIEEHQEVTHDEDFVYFYEIHPEFVRGAFIDGVGEERKIVPFLLRIETDADDIPEFAMKYIQSEFFRAEEEEGADAEE